MNLNNPSKEDLVRLLACQDDNEGTHLVWVDHSGNVQIEVLPPGHTPAGWARKMEGQYKFRMESYAQGTGYVGPEASQDDEWATILYDKLLQAWREGHRGLIDT
jgi:hypothetical protein